MLATKKTDFFSPPLPLLNLPETAFIGTNELETFCETLQIITFSASPPRPIPGYVGNRFSNLAFILPGSQATPPVERQSGRHWQLNNCQ